ncbi:hypothetical protein B0H14DRAFT_3460524 [Mycena olivaceomarginata]|nr:hypothetical protein B0H14DRAFT_3460524 [Mycena olivaceomarginata]
MELDEDYDSDVEAEPSSEKHPHLEPTERNDTPRASLKPTNAADISLQGHVLPVATTSWIIGLRDRVLFQAYAEDLYAYYFSTLAALLLH